jgi:hypothetical protein
MRMPNTRLEYLVVGVLAVVAVLVIAWAILR